MRRPEHISHFFSDPPSSAARIPILNPLSVRAVGSKIDMISLGAGKKEWAGNGGLLPLFFSITRYWIAYCLYNTVSLRIFFILGLLLIVVVAIQFSHSVVSDSLRPHESQHARPPCPLPTPRVHSNSRPLSQWCHPAISSSVIPFSSCPQSLPASGSFPISQLFIWGVQSIGVSALASFLPKNTQDWSPLGWTGWISLQSKGLSRVFSNTTVQKHQFFGTQLSSSPTLTSIHDYWKNHSLD